LLAPKRLSTLKSLRQHLDAAIAITVVIILLVLGLVFHQQIKNQLNTWKLLPEPERLTELYFAKPNNLPSTYVPGQTQVVSFTVHNLEYRTTDYSYRVIEQNQMGDQSQTLRQGKFTLLQNAYEHEVSTIVLPDMGSRVKLIVSLPPQGESIDYWAERSNQ
jgi:uncharacterized membrane protein